MPLLTINAFGLANLRGRIAAAMREISVVPPTAVALACQEVQRELEAAAPIGQISTGTAPGDDIPGRLRTSFSTQILPASETMTLGMVVTNQPTKMHFLRRGTGIYGPRGARIYPIRAKALSWIDPATGQRITRPSIAGMPPNDFVTPIVVAGRDRARTYFVQGMHEALNNVKGY